MFVFSSQTMPAHETNCTPTVRAEVSMHAQNAVGCSSIEWVICGHILKFYQVYGLYKSLTLVYHIF